MSFQSSAPSQNSPHRSRSLSLSLRLSPGTTTQLDSNYIYNYSLRPFGSFSFHSSLLYPSPFSPSLRLLSVLQETLQRATPNRFLARPANVADPPRSIRRVALRLQRLPPNTTAHHTHHYISLRMPVAPRLLCSLSCSPLFEPRPLQAPVAFPSVACRQRLDTVPGFSVRGRGPSLESLLYNANHGL